MGRLALIGAVAVAVLLGATVWLIDRETSSDPDPDATGASRFQQLAVVDPSRALAQCQPAQETLFSALAAHLSDEEDSFGDARFEHLDNGVTYLSANLLGGDGATKASTPVWVYSGAGFAALSEAAIDSSTSIPDAREQYAVDADDPAASKVAACVTAASRVAPLGAD